MKGLNKGQLQTFSLVFSVIGLVGWTLFTGPTAFATTFIGFIGVPIFCYNLVEGYKHTGNTSRYTQRLIITWAASIIPFWLYFHHFSLYQQGLLLDMMLSAMILNKLNAQFTTKGEIIGYSIALTLVSLFVSSIPMVPELLVIVFHYYGHEKKKWRNGYYTLIVLVFTAVSVLFTFIKADFVLSLSGMPWYFGLAPLGMFIAVPFLQAYNEKRGKTAVAHYFFYIVYPALYLVLGVLGLLKDISYFYFFAGIQGVLVIISAVFMWYIGRSRLTGSIVRFTNMIQFSYLFFLGYLMEFTMIGDAPRALSFRIQFGSFFLIVASATLFASGYCRVGMPKIVQRIIYYVNITMAIFLMVFPNTDNILYSNFSCVNTPYYPVIYVSLGPVLIVFIVYFALLALVQTIFCLNTIVQTRSAERMRCIWLLAGIVCPWITFGLWRFGLTNGYQVVNFGVLSCIVCDLIAMVHYGMTDPVQLASNNFLEHAVDGIMILDQSERVVYFNDVIRTLLPGVAIDMEASHIFDAGYKDLINGAEQTVSIKKRSYKVVSEPLVEANYLQGYIVRINDITAQIEELNAAKSIGYTDSLTKLYTRRYYELKIQDFFQKSNVGSFFYLDVDDFKHVNDDYSHETGDKVLRALGNSLAEVAGNEYYTCRLGGDEFSMFLPNECRYNNIGPIAQRLIDSFSAHLAADDLPGHITISIGIVTTDSIDDEAENPYTQLYNKADVALYHSKRTGKNRFCFYKEGMEKDDKDK